MGQSSSSGRRREDYSYQYPPPASSQISPSPPVPPRPPSYPYPSRSRPNYSASYPMPAPPPYPNPSSSYYPPPSGGYGRPAYHGWWYPPPSSSAAAMANPPPPPPPPPYVEHHNAKKVKNDVNVHKNTIQLVPDEQNPDQHLVSFTFDAVVDGSVTIYYFAKEEEKCSFSAIYPDIYTPRKVPFQKGLGQKFIQPSGSGIDLGFFDLDDLSRPSNGNVFPLVVYVEACPPPGLTDEQVGQLSAVANAQITLAVIDKNNNGSFQVKVLKQILWAENERYELQEIYGIANSDKTEVGANAEDTGKECVICMSEPRDTTVLPCRHMCMCSECAKALTQQSNKCPICRQPVEKLMEIKVNNANH